MEPAKKFTGRFIFAFILAVAATILNYIWMVNKAPTDGYVAVSQNVAQGEIITIRMIREVKLPQHWGDSISGLKLYRETFVPWRARNTFVGLKAVRPFQRGEMVQQSDISAIDVLPKYDILGPFRLLAVGGRFATVTAHESDDHRGATSTITIAIPFDVNDPDKMDEKTRRLVQIVENEKTRGRSYNESSELRLVGIIAFPDTTSLPVPNVPNTSRRSLGLGEDELALVVPLPNLDTIPEVLLREDSPQVGFLVPATVVRSLDSVTLQPDDWDGWEEEQQQKE